MKYKIVFLALVVICIFFSSVNAKDVADKSYKVRYSISYDDLSDDFQDDFALVDTYLKLKEEFIVESKSLISHGILEKIEDTQFGIKITMSVTSYKKFKDDHKINLGRTTITVSKGESGGSESTREANGVPVWKVLKFISVE
ncbi:MAG: hypothetical protein HYS98_07890 [Deltaproteobacteria bacterium]|nr:hypothetical protein [Deltaproteobacteria bacterium]